CDGGTKAARQNRCSSGDKTIQDHRNSQHRGAENDADHRANLQTAHLGDNIERVLRVGSIYVETLFDRRDFSSPRCVVDSRTSPNYVAWQGAGQGAQHRRRAAGVADPHISGTEKKEIFGSYFLYQANSRLDRLHGLLPPHGGPASEIICPAANFAVAQTSRRRKFIVDADVHYFDVHTAMACQDIDGGAAAEEVVGHLRRHFFGICAHTLIGNPMIGGKDKQELSPQPGWHLTLDTGDAARELF